MTLKVVTVVGARPQFIKAAAVSRAFRAAGPDAASEVLVHTGQHYDDNMSAVFFEELGIPQPQHNLQIGGGTHGAMTGRMLEGLEQVMLQERPDWVLVYGDTNSTLAGALAAAKLHLPVAHVEAGLRSFNRRMPEEINRVLTDRLSQQLHCPTTAAVAHLRAEGVSEGVHLVGDVMYDVALHYRDVARASSDALRRLGLQPGTFALVTCHRAENTDDPARLAGIVAALAELARELPVVLPLHPRTRKVLAAQDLAGALGAVQVVDPLPFLDMILLEQEARLVLTDSGGVQKEAFFFGVPCVTLRDETEWVETVEAGMNRLCGADPQAILAAARGFLRERPATAFKPYGEGNAAGRIVAHLLDGGSA
ncbi:UDP-N-acetylglucosamine 2-epimerase (non-hydrolyzing) [Caenimonas sedimenti]|uniref:UDP-N-acetylglucosamine 2-epimerase (Non-hydrolyzing) n=1 Tax=Caenimonas sedimenti TaxID=2596921 RepID=A0A562ZUM5_9BURK|nr:UDP-N-acetylglucosamine 2-epimerase (non-hydrolyzing) [Caenimonas sedimenti]TWO72097.1 UDP-N-acetylglucosamine 2-epimerase (non-hydrolyzing) [Caenimonas sedimenti]